MRRSLIRLAAALALAAGPALADDVIKVGVLTDANGPFADQAGQGSEIAAQLAADDFVATFPGRQVEILFGDRQNKISSAPIRIKKPDESKVPYDLLQLISTIPPDEAFRPVGEGGCPLVR